MRLISQDGMIDVPYEQVCIGIDYRNDKRIYAIGVNSQDNEDGSTMARYSTPEKAKEAMEMLHKTYLQSGVEQTYKEKWFIPQNVFVFPQEDEL